MAKTPLTARDVERLLADPSAQSRAEAAVKIGVSFGPALGEAERGIAEEIFRIMIKDAEVRVREALADTLKENPSIPHDVAVALASDVDPVALPLIRSSEVLSDDDLIAIIAADSETKQIAVGQRPHVSERISKALVETERESVVGTLVANDGAEISRETFDKVIDSLGEAESVQEALVRRRRMPVAIAERLLTLVSASLREELIARHEMPGGMADFLSLKILEKAQAALYSQFEVQRGLPVEMMLKYFQQEGANCRFKSPYRDRVSFRKAILLENQRDLGMFDYVFCRNVLIYFDRETQGQVLEMIVDMMPADGKLFLGSAETVLSLTDRFVAVEGVKGLYKRPDAA
ncbi:MAG: DUF2336 domain-containing protein [Rhodospirillaceae bacterium]